MSQQLGPRTQVLAQSRIDAKLRKWGPRPISKTCKAWKILPVSQIFFNQQLVSRTFVHSAVTPHQILSVDLVVGPSRSPTVVHVFACIYSGSVEQVVLRHGLSVKVLSLSPPRRSLIVSTSCDDMPPEALAQLGHTNYWRSHRMSGFPSSLVSLCSLESHSIRPLSRPYSVCL